MDTATPRTDAEHSRLLRISEGPFWIAGKDYIAMREHSEKLELELIASAERVKVLEAALRKLRSNWHQECDDPWYSRPKSEDGCANENQGTDCNCGTDRRNAIIDQALGSGK